MKRRVLDIINLVCIATTLILVGCATMKPPPRYETTQFSMHQESGGVEVFIEPFVDQNKIKKYFGTNLIAKGIFPFYVKIANGSKDTSFFVNETTFSLVVGTDNYKSLEIDEIKDVSAGFALTATGGCCTMCLGGKLASDASVINYNFNYNKLHPTTISPGKDVSGFLYFQLPKKGTIPKSWKMMVSIDNFSNNKQIKILF